MLLMVDELEKLRAKEARGSMSGRAQGVQKTLGHADKGDGENKLPRLLYFGTSYGTMLGNTFISMFPGRVKRMILDGNVVPEDYTSGVSSGPCLKTASMKFALDTDLMLSRTGQ